MMTPGIRYSDAPRCGPCGGRASLVRQSAKALVVDSFGGLEMYECPNGQGWHVWSPDVERPKSEGRQKHR
jgi:hypothetical protein